MTELNPIIIALIAFGLGFVAGGGLSLLNPLSKNKVLKNKMVQIVILLGFISDARKLLKDTPAAKTFMEDTDFIPELEKKFFEIINQG